MSFGSGGGFSFGSNTNTTPQQNTGFGGFGNNTNTGFGTSTSNTGFGASPAASNPFGGGGSTGGGSTFGSATGGFGGNTNTSSSLFGNKPASNPFSSSTNTGGGLFGSSTPQQNTGFGSSTGGFGTTANTGNTGGFGGNAGGSSFSFGANKPGFGSSSNSTPLFGQGGSGTTGGFNAGAFGAAGSGTALSNQPVPPSDGTASTPYAPTLDKDASGQQSNYQSINFMQPYQKYCFEELRLADYNAGRRYGSATGTSGGFGSSTFGGFGASSTPAFGGGGGGAPGTTGGLFGQTTTSSTGFGSGTQTTGFGGGGLFGNKPAAGGLFGGQQQQSSATATGGLFGTAGSTGGGFGSTPSGGFGSGSSTAGGLFGQQQTKPGGLFGGSTTTSAPSFSFGNTAPASGGTGLFGGSGQQQQQQPQQQQQSGGLFGSATQQKPLFGGTSGGFGTSTPQSQPAGGLFGASANQSGGGLFGNNTPASGGTGTGLFGSTGGAAGTPMFGGQQQQQQKPGGLFGGSTFGTNQPSAGGGLFGGTGTNTQQQSGGFSFGNAAQKPATTSLFGNNGAQQQGGLFGQSAGTSLFGTSQMAQQGQQGQQQQPDFKQSSLNDPNPYGQTSIWTGLPVPTPETAKPLFTPLSATQKMKESQAKPPPSLRLSQSRYMTPPRRSGFGFSYSTYGTPNSAASTPGAGGLTSSMYGSRSFTGGSFGRSFGKSASASNLRSQFSGDGEGVLSPSAFAPSTGRWSGGNMRRLTIDRSIRNDLFSRPALPALPSSAPEKPTGTQDEPVTINGAESSTEPSKLKKRVSFDKGTVGGQEGTLNGANGALVRTEADGEASERGRTVNGSATPEAEPTRGNELAVVPEDRESDHVSSSKQAVQAKTDPQPGDYWMKPSRAELSKMPREKLQKFVGFEVGRKGCGKVVFNGAVDLTALPLDDLYEKIVEIRLRSVTVYPDPSSKPPVGRGLNVPSTISIENSWPRSRGQPSSATTGPVFEKHVNRLKKMQGTEFVNYEVSTGVWTFRVPHYTRYGLDYDEDEELGQSQMSMPPDSLSGPQSGNISAMEVDSEDQDDTQEEDDTFAFKQKTVPGGFGRRSAIDDDTDVPTAQMIEEDVQDSDIAAQSESEDNDHEVSVAGSFPPLGAQVLLSPNKPILKASRLGTPGKRLVSLDGDWAEQLQRTISPRKQNREALRDVQNNVLLDRAYEPMKPKSSNKNEFRTSIDIMNSLFSRHEERMAKGRKGQAAPDLEFPYAKRAKTFDDESGMTENDVLWHTSFKPHFTEGNKLIYKTSGASEADAAWTDNVLIESGGEKLGLTSLRPTIANMDTSTLMADAQIKLVENVPFAKHNAVPLSQARDQVLKQGASTDELDVYELAHVLFDDYDDEFTFGLSRQQKREFHPRIQKDRLSKFLADLVWRRHAEKIQASEKGSAAAAAILHLTAKNVKAACDALTREKDIHLSLLVAQIEQADDTFQNDLAEQIDAWRQQGVLSEMSEEIRAVYELLAGNTTIAQGKQNVPVEDKASTFAISEKFELDWVQALSLCLWYGRQKNGDVASAICDFEEKVVSRQEAMSPANDGGKEDPLWVILKLLASMTQGGAGVEAPVFPQALSALSQPWNSMNAFRLHHTIAAAVPAANIEHDEADNLALALAFEHSARGNVIGAVWALLHISDSRIRGYQIREFLNKHAAVLPSPPDMEQMDVVQSQGQGQGQLWSDLTTQLKVPGAWICHAKALYARSCNDSLLELTFLLRADEYEHAHECLLKRVAPRLVIDEDWDTLRTVLAKFGEHPEDNVDTAEWQSGGQVYADFVLLMMETTNSNSSATGHGAAARRPSNAGETETRRKTILQRLQSALIGLNGQFAAGKGLREGLALDLVQDKVNLEQRVALCEMGRAVARAIEMDAQEGLGGKKPILDLPLTADARLTHARVLGVEYYRGVMAMAR